MFLLQKINLWHFSRECHENLNIRTLRIKFCFKSSQPGYPQDIPNIPPRYPRNVPKIFIKVISPDIYDCSTIVFLFVWNTLIWL